MSSTSYESSSDRSSGPDPASLDAQRQARATTYRLPLKPVIIIKATKPWSPLNLHSLWVYRELLYFLIWRDL